MTKIFCDANVLIYYFSLNTPQHTIAVELLNKLVEEENELVVSPFVLNEVHFIFQKNAQAAISKLVISSILGMKSFKLVDFLFKKKDMLEVSRISEKYHLKTSDAFHAYYCKKLGIKKIATFDNDFKRVSFLTTLS